MPRAYSSVICSASGFANATFSYLEKASHRKIFIKKVNAVALRLNAYFSKILP